MIDKKNLMRLAWAWAKQDLWSARAEKSQLRSYFQKALVRAWKEQKNKVPRVYSARISVEIRKDIQILESKDKLRGPDWVELDRLYAELRNARK